MNKATHKHTSKHTSKHARSLGRKGFGLVEAVTSACFVIVAAILSIDCWFMINAARITDAACRDAARAAAQTADSTTANNAAMAAVQPYTKYGNTMMTAPVVTVKYNDTASPPSVTVVTSMSVNPLIPLSVLGSSFNAMNFSQQYSFPLIKSFTGVTAQYVNGTLSSSSSAGKGSSGGQTPPGGPPSNSL